MIDHPEVQKFVRVASRLAQNGWAEANAGNMSVRLDEYEVDLEVEGGEEFPVEGSFPSLAGMHFLVTATRGRMRDIPRDPAAALGLVMILDGGKKYRCLWGRGPCTSEFPSHLSIHAMCVADRPSMRAVLHTHPPHLIAMTHMPEMQGSETIGNALRRVHPELSVLMPRGIALSDYRIPGSLALANATIESLRRCDMALWSMHGVVSLATDLEMAYDHVEMYEKAAKIYLMVLAAGSKLRGLSDENIEEIRKTFGNEWADE